MRSLQLLERHLAAAAKQPAAKKAVTAAALSAVLPHLLAALSSHAAEVRAAALDLLAPGRPAAAIAAKAPAGAHAIAETAASVAACVHWSCPSSWPHGALPLRPFAPVLSVLT